MWKKHCCWKHRLVYYVDLMNENCDSLMVVVLRYALGLVPVSVKCRDCLCDVPVDVDRAGAAVAVAAADVVAAVVAAASGLVVVVVVAVFVLLGHVAVFVLLGHVASVI